MWKKWQKSAFKTKTMRSLRPGIWYMSARTSNSIGEVVGGMETHPPYKN